MHNILGDSTDIQRHLLTIAIPTYDRNTTLRTTLGALVPQVTPSCKLLILDNHSPEPVEESVQDLLARLPMGSWNVVRNRYNIGANSNVLRCMELCETPWLWILGDDDIPRATAVEKILSAVTRCSDSAFLYFACEQHFPLDEDCDINGVNQFLEWVGNSMSRLEAMGFTSTSVCRMESITPYLRFGNHFSYSNLPLPAMLLLALERGATCSLCAEPILADITQAPPESLYDHLELALGRTVLLDLPLAPCVRDRLARLFELSQWTPKQTALDLLGRIRAGRDPRDMLYVYDQLLHRLAFRDHSARRMVERRVYRLVVRYPRLAFAFLHRVYYPYLKGRPAPTLGSSGQSGRFDRV